MMPFSVKRRRTVSEGCAPLASQALAFSSFTTIVRATAEGRIQVEILDTDEFYDDSEENEEGEEPQDAPE